MSVEKKANKIQAKLEIFALTWQMRNKSKATDKVVEYAGQ